MEINKHKNKIYILQSECCMLKLWSKFTFGYMPFNNN